MMALNFTPKETKRSHQSVVSLVSDLRLPQAAMKFKTMYAVDAVATSERLSYSADCLIKP